MVEHLHWIATETRPLHELLSLSSMPCVGVQERDLLHICAEHLTNRRANSSRIRCLLPTRRRGHGEAIPLASERFLYSAWRVPRGEAGRIFCRVPLDSFTIMMQPSWQQ